MKQKKGATQMCWIFANHHMFRTVYGARLVRYFKTPVLNDYYELAVSVTILQLIEVLY